AASESFGIIAPRLMANQVSVSRSLPRFGCFLLFHKLTVEYDRENETKNMLRRSSVPSKCARSSAGQSNGFLIRRSKVRVLPGAQPFSGSGAGVFIGRFVRNHDHRRSRTVAHGSEQKHRLFVKYSSIKHGVVFVSGACLSCC